VRAKGLVLLIAVLTTFLAAASAAEATTYIKAPDFQTDWNQLYLQERPRDLIVGPLGGSLAELAILRRVRWRRWGRPKATARARHKTKDYEPWHRVRVRVYRRRHCGEGFYLYTRIRTRTQGITDVARLPGCSAPYTTWD
jgi:hypothetical protein